VDVLSILGLGLATVAIVLGAILKGAGVHALVSAAAFMIVVAVAVSFSIQVTGTLLIFSLMVTPAATAAYLSRKPQRAILISIAIALTVTWSGIFISYFTAYPTSFFIASEAFGVYLVVRLTSGALKYRVRNSRPSPPVATISVSME